MPLFDGLNTKMWLNKRGRGRVPRKVRLAISLAVLILLIVGVVLLVRGCASRPDQTVERGAPDGQVVTAGANAQTDQPDDPGEVTPPTTADPDQPVGDEPVSDQPVGEEPKGEDALDGIGEQQVDMSDFAEPVSTPSVPVGSRSVTIRSIGDIVGHIPILRSVYNAETKEYDFSPILASAKSSMGSADYTVLNVDGPMPGRKAANGYKGYPQFNTPPYLLNALKDAGVDMLTLANNHALDTYFDGLKATLDNVDKVGFDHIGTYRTQEEHDAPYIKDIGGIRIGFLNYTEGTNGLAKKSDPDASVYGLRMTGNSDVFVDVAQLRAAGAEVVVVYMHWGEEYNRTVTKSLRNTAKKLVSAGADVVVGGHQHVVLPCEWLSAKSKEGEDRTALVFYGMGNFLSDQRTRYRDSGCMVQFTLQDNPDTGKVEVVAPKYIPTYVHRTGTKNDYTYRVLMVGDTIADPPSGLSSDVLNRVKQVWNEQKEVMEGGPAEALRH